MRKTSKRDIVIKNGYYYQGRVKVHPFECKSCGANVFRQKPNKQQLYYCNDKCEEKYKDPIGAKMMEQKDSDDFHYLIGLIGADGNLQKEAKGVSICMSKKEKSNIELFMDIKNRFGGIIEEYKDNCMYWKIHNKEFSDFLISIGFSSNKTFTLDITQWFKKLDKHKQDAFMRGFWDGDGTFYIGEVKNKPGVKIYRSQIGTASVHMFELIKYYIKDEFTTRVEQGINGLFYKIRVCKGQQIIKKFNVFYPNTSCLHLKRKYNKYEEIKEYVNTRLNEHTTNGSNIQI